MLVSVLESWCDVGDERMQSIVGHSALRQLRLGRAVARQRFACVAAKSAASPMGKSETRVVF